MDISSMSLPLRKERSSGNLFGVSSPALSSVNISYETAEAHLNDSEDNKDSSSHETNSVDSVSSHSISDVKPILQKPEDKHEFPKKKVNISPSTSMNYLDFPSSGFSKHKRNEWTNSISGSKSIEEHPPSPRDGSVRQSPTRSRSASRASFSVASVECQSFVASLKEPKYAKPLSSDEIGWVFQDFYLKLKQDLLGSENELRTQEEQDERDQMKRNIDSILDKAEKFVTGGELHSKLFALDGSYDSKLQPRINLIRETPEIFTKFAAKLGVNPSSEETNEYITNHEDTEEEGERNGTSANETAANLSTTTETSPDLSTGNLSTGNSSSANLSAANLSTANLSTSDISAISRTSSSPGDGEVVDGINVRPAISYINRISRETAPKLKLMALIKAHCAIADAVASSSAGDADTVFPLFVYSLMRSDLSDWWQNFRFIQKFRRASELSGQGAYCLTNFEAAIHFVEQFTVSPSDLSSDTEGIPDISQLEKPLSNPRTVVRQRSASQNSRGSSAATASFSQRLGETFNSYKSMLSVRKPSPMVEQRFLTADADSLTLADVRVLLREYKRLAEEVETRRT